MDLFSALTALLLTAPGVAVAPAAPAPPVLADYLPPGVPYDGSVPTPQGVLGFEVGEWHVRHDQLAAYVRTLAASSDRMQLETLGKTHEQRPLLALIISAPENLARLESIRENHLALGNPATAATDRSTMPAVVWLGYSVHGNEPSGSNAALVVAYHLAAAQDAQTTTLLRDTVILLVPSINPDGLSRFAQWANMHKGQALVADPQHREHNEGWPAGRTNHYWFDLNRDWLLAQHPESRGHLALFHRFRPNIVTDFHEMGTSATYFFQPGVPSRTHPRTPERNQALTREIAAYHARTLDRHKRLYFTEEVFDDFYYGKGSTYPDIQGAVGILFEQASARGHRQETPNGLLTFPFAIHNQVLTSFSTLEAAQAKRQALLDYQADFARAAADEAMADMVQAYAFGDAYDPARAAHLVTVLRHHGIIVHRLGEAVDGPGGRLTPGPGTYIVPTRQPQYRLLKALFETRTRFADETFYDVSAWTAPLAFGLEATSLGRAAFRPALLGEEVVDAPIPSGTVTPRPDAVAYAFTWDGYHAPRALYRLLAAGLRARVASRPFSAETDRGRQDFPYGTIIVPTGIQDVPAGVLDDLLPTLASEDGIEIYALATGLTAAGIDLGSPTLRVLETPKVAMVVGSVSPYEAGEVWYLLDRHVGLPLTMIDAHRLHRADLSRYTHLVLVSGDYSSLEPMAEAIGEWVGRGGVVVATRGAAQWVGDHLLPGEEPAGPPEPPTSVPETSERRPYASHERQRAIGLVSGAIFEVDLDLTHPLAYGYRRTNLPVFRTDTEVLPTPANPYVTVAAYTAQPLLSGYASQENRDLIAGTPALIAERLGEGAVIRLADNPNFRGYWYGTSKLFLNALFFGSTLQQTGP